MLNAELKSMNSILTYESFLSRCVRAGWRAVAMASSVERLDLYANWKGSKEGGRTDLMCCMTSRSKHFIGIGVSATGHLVTDSHPHHIICHLGQYTKEIIFWHA